MILTFRDGSEAPAWLGESAGMAFPQYGQVPDVTPALAATGDPQVGHSPIWVLLSWTPSTADGLKHMTESSFRVRNILSVHLLRFPR